MDVDIAALIQSLSPYVRRSTVKNDEKITFSAIGFFDNKNPPEEGAVLYIGNASDLPDSIDPVHPVCLICIENCDIPSFYSESTSVRMIVLESAAELKEIYNTVNALLGNERCLRHASDTLFQAVMNDAGIQELCNIAYELLGNPVAIQDNSMKHIAYTPSNDVDDAVWMEFTKNDGYVSNDTMLLFTAQIEYKQDFNQQTPFIMSKGKFKYRRLVSHIFINQKAVGTMVIIESMRPFRETDYPVVTIISRVLSLEMRKSNFILYSRGLAYEFFFKDLLDGMHNEALINEKIKTLNLQIKENLYVLTIDISEFDNTYKSMQYFRDTLDKILFGCKSIIYNDFIVMILMRNSGCALTESELKEMNNFLDKNNLYGGISQCFDTIADLREHFNQAVAAASLCRRIKKVSRLSNYEDYVVYHLIDIAEHEVDLHQLCSRPLLKLIDYDRQNNTPYAQNLHQYLLNERNIAHTTIALHTHRNTLIYRLKKIEEIMQVDLGDSEVRLQLLLTYKILELL